MGFIALLTPLKIKFKSFICTEFYQYGCVFKKAHEGRLRLF